MQLSSRHLISAYDYPRDDLRYVIQTADCRIQVCGELGIVPLYESDGVQVERRRALILCCSLSIGKIFLPTQCLVLGIVRPLAHCPTASHRLLTILVS
jgi:hypothetical protein